MISHNLGYPRIGTERQLKKACEKYWSGKIGPDELAEAGRGIRRSNWLLQRGSGLDLVPSNDFSFYDNVLDMCYAVGAIPERYAPLADRGDSETDTYFAMARGYDKDGLDITAMEMTKWFDTNYHYIVPEFHRNQCFEFQLSQRRRPGRLRHSFASRSYGSGDGRPYQEGSGRYSRGTIVGQPRLRIEDQKLGGGKARAEVDGRCRGKNAA